MAYIYPAVFHPNDDGSYTVSFPDLRGCITEGKDLTHALQMAKDVLCVWLDSALEENDQFPKPSPPETLAIQASEFVSIIDADIEAYRKEHDSRPVRRTVSIPKWLDTEARAAGLSLSRVLQDALSDRLR